MTAFETTRSRLLRWGAALGFVAAVHGGAVAWALRSPPPDDFESQTGGAFIIELSSVTASPEDERLEIAIGPRANEVPLIQASAPVVASSTEPVPDEVPPVPEVKEPPPEDTVQSHKEEKPPEEEQPPEAPKNEAKDAPNIAPPPPSEAMAPRTIENATKTSEKPTGQNAGLAQIDRQAIQNWQRDLAVHINKYKRYPSKARDARQHASVRVSFSIDRGGRVLRAWVEKSTSYDLFDEAAVDMVNRASPFPPPPDDMPGGEVLTYVVPVKFRGRD